MKRQPPDDPDQLTLLDDLPVPHFDGRTYEPERDHERLARQTLRVFVLMQDCRWRTLATIAAYTGDPEASISARLRDLRKTKFGSHTVNRRYLRDGLFEYQVVENRDTVCWPRINHQGSDEP